ARTASLRANSAPPPTITSTTSFTSPTQMAHSMTKVGTPKSRKVSKFFGNEYLNDDVIDLVQKVNLDPLLELSKGLSQYETLIILLFGYVLTVAKYAMVFETRLFELRPDYKYG